MIYVLYFGDLSYFLGWLEGKLDCWTSLRVVEKYNSLDEA